MYLLVSVDSLDVDTKEIVKGVRLHLQCRSGKEILIRRESSSLTDSFFLCLDKLNKQTVFIFFTE